MSAGTSVSIVQSARPEPARIGVRTANMIGVPSVLGWDARRALNARPVFVSPGAHENLIPCRGQRNANSSPHAERVVNARPRQHP